MNEIKLTDLRIGNLIKDYLGSIVSVTGILENKIYHSENKIGVTHGNSMQPIELTEEWLLKLGFEPAEINTKVNGEPEKGYIKNLLMMLPVDTLKGILFYAAPYGYPINLHRTIYVHQLQNLYYFLVGEELTIEKDDIK